MKEFLTAELIGKSSRLLSNNLALKLLKNDINLTKEQWIILQIISNGDKTQKELVQITLKNKASINSLISNLLKLGFITKIASKADRRTTIISITNNGNLVREEANKFALTSTKEAMSGFSIEEVERLNVFLNRINKNLYSK